MACTYAAHAGAASSLPLHCAAAWQVAVLFIWYTQIRRAFLSSRTFTLRSYHSRNCALVLATIIVTQQKTGPCTHCVACACSAVSL